MLRDTRRRFSVTLLSIVGLAGAMACGDERNFVAPVVPTTTAGSHVSRTTLACTATLHPKMVTCTPVNSYGAGVAAASRVNPRNVIVGKQSVYVYLALSNYQLNGSTFEFDATVQNLMTQPLGTQNGTAVAGGGVDVFFTAGPAVNCGTGTVSAVGTQTGTFTASGQQYYQYNQIIKPDSTSAAQLWQFQLSSNVCGFNFYVEVSGDMPAEQSVLRWTAIRQGVTNNQLNGAWGDGLGNVFAAGLNGSALMYNGTTWSALPLNQSTYQLRAVYGTSKTDVWFVGDAGVATHYNGTGFTEVSPGTTNLKGVWEANSTNIYAIGGAINVWQSRNGTSWTAVAVPHGIADTLRAIWGADSAHIFIVGDDGRLLFYNGTGSTGWTQFAKPNGDPPFRGVWGTSATNVFACATNGAIYQYNGTAWTAMTSPITSELDAINGSSATNIWAVGDSGKALKYNGTAWDTVARVTYYNLHGVTAAASPVWAVGDMGTLVSYTGTTGTMSSQSGNPITHLWASGPTDIWASTYSAILHYNGTSWSTALFLTKTTNPAGTAAPDTLINVIGFGGAADTNIHALGQNGTVAIWNGTSFDTVQQQLGTGWNAEWGTTAPTLCAVGNAGEYDCNTGEGGRVGNEPYLTSLWGSSATSLFAGGTNGDVYVSTNGAASWTQTTTGTGDSILAVWGSSATAIWASGEAGVMYMSTNGTTWTAQASGTTNALRALWADAPPSGYTGDVYAVGDNGTIQHYNGTGWTPMWSGVTTRLRTVFGTSSTSVYIGGDDGVVLVGSQ
jgi:hypothetical protein